MESMFGNLKMRYNILITNAVAILLLILFAVIINFKITDLLNTALWISHTEKVIATGHELMENLLNMETGERGYLITGREEFLKPFKNSENIFYKKLSEAKELVSDNPA